MAIANECVNVVLLGPYIKYFWMPFNLDFTSVATAKDTKYY